MARRRSGSTPSRAFRPCDAYCRHSQFHDESIDASGSRLFHCANPVSRRAGTRSRRRRRRERFYRRRRRQRRRRALCRDASCDHWRTGTETRLEHGRSWSGTSRPPRVVATGSVPQRRGQRQRQQQQQQQQQRRHQWPESEFEGFASWRRIQGRARRRRRT